jgi:hypothetical protein
VPEVIPLPSVSVGSVVCIGDAAWRVNAFRDKALAGFRPKLDERRRTPRFDS